MDDTSRLNRVVLKGVVVEGPMVVHQRTSRVVLRLSLEVDRGSSIAVSMWDPPAEVALRAMTTGPGSVASVRGHLESLVDFDAGRPNELVVVADELTLGPPADPAG